MDTKVYACRRNGFGVSFYLCGEKSRLLVPHTGGENGAERHVPFVLVRDNVVEVNVGVVDHPMSSAHYIAWIYLETDRNGQSITLEPYEEPRVVFCLGNEMPRAVYAYCTSHGLWMTHVNTANFVSGELTITEGGLPGTDLPPGR